jgi:hypothetical protein
MFKYVESGVNISTKLRKKSGTERKEKKIHADPRESRNSWLLEL